MFNKYQIRKFFNAGVAMIPKKLLAGFFRAFELRPEIAERAGYHAHPRLFYSPLPLTEEIVWDQLEQPRHLPAVEFLVPAALKLLNQIKRHSAELDVNHDQRPSVCLLAG